MNLQISQQKAQGQLEPKCVILGTNIKARKGVPKYVDLGRY